MAYPPGLTSKPTDRREEVIRAALTVIARDGLDRASLRAIAQELGCSTGVITHYFRDKDAMLVAILQSIEKSSADGRSELLDLPPTTEYIYRYLAKILPSRKEQIDSWRVWLSFTVASFTRPRPSLDHAEYYVTLQKTWAKILGRLQQAGTIRSDVDTELEAEALLCLIDGIGIHGTISPNFTAERQRALLDSYFTKLTAR